MGGLLMHMRRLSTVTLITILLLQTVAINYMPNAESAVAKGGSKDDFSIFSITVGNQSQATEKWIQPDGEVTDYVLQDSTIEVNVTITKDGPTSGTPKQTDAKLEIVHPIGFVIETFTWTSNVITGQQKDYKIFSWNPQAAHSVLDTSTNQLTGGLILRASVNYSEDDRNDNDIMEKQVPVAVYKDLFDGEGPGTSLTFRPARYPVGGGDANNFGSWYEDSSDAAVGSSHWRMSSPSNGNDYPANAFDRLVHSYKNPNNNCGNDQLDSGLTNVEQAWVCRKIFYSSEYISSQVHVQAWGTMGAGDKAYLEFWTGSGNFSDPYQSVHWDVAAANPSPIPGQWKNISWDPQTVWSQNPTLANPDLFLGGNSYTFGLVFKSDSSAATKGMHFDDFVQFGISKVDDYTLTANCDQPETGFEAFPNGLVSWKCDVTNNGYRNVQFRAQTNVTNSSWMDPVIPQLRLDTTNPNDNDFNVVIPPIGAFETTTVWANLSVPPGADVQIQNWEIWFTDASSANSGEKARVSTTVSINSQYSVRLSSQASQIALTLDPGQTDNMSFKVQNTGNLDSTFELRSTFSQPDWEGVVYDELGNAITSVFLEKGKSADVIIAITAAPLSTPGDISLTLRATRTSGDVVGDTTLSRITNVPIYKDFALIPSYDIFKFENDRTFIEGYADGNAKSVFITLENNGNSEERFNLSVQNSDWKVGAYLDDTQSPLMDDWGSEWIFKLNLPMPVGLVKGFYTVTITATNVDDPSVSTSVSIDVDILETAAVYVETDESDQSFIPGASAQQMEFEVRNDGNVADKFEMSLDIPQGMNAEFTDLIDGKYTRTIESGESTLVTVSFSFDEGVSGTFVMGLIAKTDKNPQVSAVGGSTYNVGGGNLLLKILPSQQVIIDNFEDDVILELTVRNQFSLPQSVTMDYELGESTSWFQTRIVSDDQTFTLGTGENSDKIVRIKFSVSETTLLNLDEATFDTQITIFAQSQSESDVAQSVIDVQLRKLIIETEDESSSSFDVAGVATWIGFIGIILAGVFVLLKILKNTGEEEDDYGGWGDEYQDSLTATYQSVAAAPTVPSGPPTSVPSTPPPIAPAVPAQPVAPSAPVAPAQPAGPPLPESGLPQGWTMEQWNAYGHQWLEQYGNN